MTRWLLLALSLVIFAADGNTAEPLHPSKKAQENARTVTRTLRAHLTPPPGAGWDEFTLRIVEDVDGDAYATAAGWEEWGDGKPTPYVKISSGYLVVYGSHPDALALTVGRELGRIALGYVTPKGVPAPAGGACFLRRADVEIDQFAARLLLKSGYSLPRAIQGVGRGSIELPEKLRPVWSDRLARLDVWRSQNEDLVRLTPTFQTGAWFLAIEENRTAAIAFDKLTRDFPESFELWAYLGYAKFLAYFDQLSAGGSSLQVPWHVLGTSSSIRTYVPRQGADKDAWFIAVAALREAERLRPGQPFVLATLGLAHLLHPDETGLDEAEKYLIAAMKALKEQGNPQPASEIELLVNRAVGRLAAGKTAEARKLLDEAETLAPKLPTGPRAAVERAIAFNRALALVADGKHAEAAKLFVQFLESSPRYDPWWTEGYRHYLALCKPLRVEPLTKDKLRKTVRRTAQIVTLAGGKTVGPGDDLDELLSRFGKPTRIMPALPGGTLEWFQFESLGIEILAANGEDVVAVLLTSPKGPVVKLPGSGGQPGGELRVGMTRKEVEALPGGGEFALRPFAPHFWPRAYYPAWELAVRYDRDGPDGVVTSLLVGPVAEGR